jgi:hypothetical protein
VAQRRMTENRRERSEIHIRDQLCRFCLHSRPLVDSHVVPAFVFRWQRETSATGYLRSGARPNLRMQDGWKRPMLCVECETIMSRYESSFAMTLFRQIVEEQPGPYRYNADFARFLACVVWRALVEWIETDPLDMLTPPQREHMTRALNRWRDFILDRVSGVGPYELHVLPLGIATETTQEDLPPNTNFYLARAVETHVASNDQAAFVYVKMGPMLTFGFFDGPPAGNLEGTKVFETGGFVGGRMRVAQAVVDYIADRVRVTMTNQRLRSQRQRALIRDAYKRNPDRLARSDTFRAVMADIQMFGAHRVFPES